MIRQLYPGLAPPFWSEAENVTDWPEHKALSTAELLMVAETASEGCTAMFVADVVMLVGLKQPEPEPIRRATDVVLTRLLNVKVELVAPA